MNGVIQASSCGLPSLTTNNHWRRILCIERWFIARQCLTRKKLEVKETPIQIEPSKVPVTYQAIVAIRVRSPQILAAVEALQHGLRDDSNGLPFRIRQQPLGSLHITLARVVFPLEGLER